MNLEMLKQRTSSATSDHETISNAMSILSCAPLECLFSYKNYFQANFEEFIDYMEKTLTCENDRLPDNLGELIANIENNDYSLYILRRLWGCLAALHEGYMIDSFGGVNDEQ